MVARKMTAAGGQSHFNQQGLLTSRLARVGNATSFDYIGLIEDGWPDALSEMVEPGGRTTWANCILELLDAFGKETIVNARVATGVLLASFSAIGLGSSCVPPDHDPAGQGDLQPFGRLGRFPTAGRPAFPNDRDQTKRTGLEETWTSTVTGRSPPPTSAPWPRT
jgi:hypothetical protein